LGVVVFVVYNFVPFTKSEAKTKEINFTTEYTEDTSLAFGIPEQVTVQGTKGKKEVVYETIYRLNGDTIKTEEVSSKVLVEVVNEKIRRDSHMYKYMWCSDGSYQSFDDPNQGFHKSMQDYCAKNGNGYATQLSDMKPVNNTVQTYTDTSGGGAICGDGSRSYSTGRGTCSWHGGVNRWL
jgi:hypothetical protein